MHGHGGNLGKYKKGQMKKMFNYQSPTKQK